MSRLYRWFETRIDPFERPGIVRPPERLGSFYWHFVKPVWPLFVVLLVAGFLGSGIEVLLMAFIGRLVDLMRAAASPEAFFSEHGAMLSAMAVVALVIRPLVSVFHDLVKNQMIATTFTNRIRWQTHGYILRQSLGFFQNDFAGRIASKIIQTAPALRESIVQLIDALWYALVQFFGAAALFAAADWRLTVPLAVWLAAYVAALAWFVPRIRDRSTAASEARSMLTGRIVDSYTNILTVKLFAHTDREDAYARAAMEEQISTWQASLRLITSMEFLLYVMNGMLLVAATGVALWLWSSGHVSIGAIAVVIGLVIRIVTMSGWVMWTIAGIFENIGVVHEGMQTISRPQQVLDAPGAHKLMVPEGEIRFENVSFHYERVPEPLSPADDESEAGDAEAEAMGVGQLMRGGVIDDLSLVIRPGERVGLVGRSGAGKSTLVNLLMRFYDLESGRILIDGQDIAAVTQDSLRAKIGMVTQDTSLLHRSVLDNILYGRPEAGEAAAVASARRAEAHEFIVGLEDLKGRRGYEAQVGERGVKLSGGQRQRIAIARVLLKDAPILVLDEATSALDSEVEAAIQKSLMTLMAGKTVIAIAHRLSTIAAMDRLVILDKGRIVEEGSHGDLIRRGGLYADLWARQSGGFLAKEAAE